MCRGQWGDPTQFLSYLAIMSSFSFMFPFMWMCELQASMFVYYAYAWCLWVPEEGLRCPASEVAESCELPCGAGT